MEFVTIYPFRGYLQLKERLSERTTFGHFERKCSSHQKYNLGRISMNTFKCKLMFIYIPYNIVVYLAPSIMPPHFLNIFVLKSTTSTYDKKKN